LRAFLRRPPLSGEAFNATSTGKTMVRRRPRWFLAISMAVIALMGAINIYRSTSPIRWGRQLFLHEGLVEVLQVEDATSLVVRALDGPAAQYNGTFRVRLLGIAQLAAKSIEQRDRADRALQLTRQFVADADRRLYLVFDRHRFDATETPLAYVVHGEECLNEQLMASGLVELDQPAGLPSKRMRTLIQIAGAAPRRDNGLWSQRTAGRTVER
jgi:hypothetical protein